ncbi:TPA: proton-conducting transporter membrane subunit [Legionella pneumophila]|uniref:Oxidoreductase n=1 Tax=Legionella pneumophila TaxID=446 RepID=A0A2S6F7S6_LEGPN|nr:proton-conducting transporter membrane subunit [Legionella pneumophila]APF02100.1 oxidoreductase [Legionella pneumophila subsp. fraseri]APF05111.1 oxidoreductase [Legionella pneumophila subsp. fraseri]AUB67582.1 oxidoreductase [Legionella pneumophila]AUB70555.1 oxidoreductase [Legionella pneumophila]KXB24518.1 oxidoreductase [Legionella pneumophila]
MEQLLNGLSISLILSPLLAIFFYLLLGKKRNTLATYYGTSAIGIGFLFSLLALIVSSGTVNQKGYFLFHVSTLSLLLTTLILFISFIIHRFSIRYMHGDKSYRRYFFNLSAITSTTMVMALADNFLLFWLAWSVSNLLLINLMIHKSQWKAAYNSGILTLKTLLPGSLFLLTAFGILFASNNTLSIETITSEVSNKSSLSITVALGFIILTAMAQSAIWPFHRWLMSSLNSPTPVSALMHAGLVNGGGFLIVKFAPLFVVQTNLLAILFIFGALTALLGTLWKLLQWNIKSMLASSTMAQMGFMMMQCGLGLFPAAIAHLCWHGLFKSYLFLNSGSALQQKKYQNKSHPEKLTTLLISFVGGLAGMYGFAFITGKPILSLQASTFLLSFAFITGTQLTLGLIAGEKRFKKVMLTLALVFSIGIFYGGSIHLIESLLPNLTGLPQYQLTSLQGLTMIVFFSLWIVFSLGLFKKIRETRLWDWFYMYMFNASTPHPKTITANRHTYYY